jgi:predicted MFS family arabinose efflux permease
VASSARWRVISALGIVQILAWGSSYYLPAVLAPSIVADTGWPLPWVIGGLSAGLLVAGLVSPWVGHRIARHGGRPVLAASALLLASGQVTLGLAPSLPVFLGGWGLLGAGMGAGLYDAAFATLGTLYGATARPAITHLTLWGGFASTVCWPLSAWLVAHVGWRGACLVYAGIQVAVALPLILLLIPRRIVAKGDTGAAPVAEVVLSRDDRRAFRLLALIVPISGVVAALISVHLLTLLEARGIALAAAVGFGALIGPSQVAGRIVEMAGGGRHPPIWTMVAAIVLIALGLGLLWGGVAWVALALVVYAAGNGVFSIARGTLPLVLFGPDRYAVLMGRLALPSLVAQALAPSIGAYVLERFGASVTLGMVAGLAIVNVVFVLALRAVMSNRPV